MPAIDSFQSGVAACQQGRWHEAIDAFWAAARVEKTLKRLAFP
mgnify:CR=1 FL=1